MTGSSRPLPKPGLFNSTSTPSLVISSQKLAGNELKKSSSFSLDSDHEEAFDQEQDSVNSPVSQKEVIIVPIGQNRVDKKLKKSPSFSGDSDHEVAFDLKKDYGRTPPYNGLGSPVAQWKPIIVPIAQTHERKIVGIDKKIKEDKLLVPLADCWEDIVKEYHEKDKAFFRRKSFESQIFLEVMNSFWLLHEFEKLKAAIKTSDSFLTVLAGEEKIPSQDLLLNIEKMRFRSISLEEQIKHQPARNNTQFYDFVVSYLNDPRNANKTLRNIILTKLDPKKVARLTSESDSYQEQSLFKSSICSKVQDVLDSSQKLFFILDAYERENSGIASFFASDESLSLVRQIKQYKVNLDKLISLNTVLDKKSRCWVRRTENPERIAQDNEEFLTKTNLVSEEQQLLEKLSKYIIQHPERKLSRNIYESFHYDPKQDAKLERRRISSSL